MRGDFPIIFDANEVRASLQRFDFRGLFISNLGWDNHPSRPFRLEVLGFRYLLTPVAEKRGFAAFTCQEEDGGPIPAYPIRLRIERLVSKLAHEHMIVYIDKGNTKQIWQWVKRQIGQPMSSREQSYYPNQRGDPLLQKLRVITFDVSEEDGLTIVDVTDRTRLAFDVEKVTKRFYELYSKQHRAFSDTIKGISDAIERGWYTSLMLDRLMFIYFIQKKSFLDNDQNYLRNKLRQVQQLQGKNRFVTFYRYFLLRLVHEGLGSKSRSSELEGLIGRVPYLNGGLFAVHELERENKGIEIPDTAFVKIFDFFDSFQWYLDDRPLRRDNEINPDVLGYIFEKYVNQREMGAYYTKDDITDYMTKNIILLSLFTHLEKRGHSHQFLMELVNTLVRSEPDRYIFDTMRYGVITDDGAETELPADIKAGVDNVKERGNWNGPASPSLAKDESWREYVARRRRCLEVRGKLSSGTLSGIDECVSLNLDTRQLLIDLVQGCESPKLLLSIYSSLRELRVLDPTCGSGAFLFQTLNMLEALYEAALGRMEVFVEEKGLGAGSDLLVSEYSTILEEVQRHPNRRYFILKSIILGNLFGVDIMEEAVEICKLRLFLKLAAQIDPDFSKENLGLEPLPDIDFNIRCGNTLVGFAHYADVEASITQGQLKLGGEDTLKSIRQKAELADEAFVDFRESQRSVLIDEKRITTAKRTLETRLSELREELDSYEAIDYGVNENKKGAFQHWNETYRPFHWFLEFYAMMKSGGFDVVVGNPPYLETKEVQYLPQGFKCEETKAIHAMCVERSLSLLRPGGSISMILPLSIVSTQRMQVVQNLIEEGRTVWYSNYSWRPGKLFDTVNRALTIFVASPKRFSPQTLSTAYQRWNSDEREYLFQLLRYTPIPRDRPHFWAPKFGSEIEPSILRKVLSAKSTMKEYCSDSTYLIYRRSTGGLYWKVFTDFPPYFRLNGKKGHSSRETSFSVTRASHLKPIIATLSSDVYWWWYTISTNLRDLNAVDIEEFPVPPGALNDPEVSRLGKQYIEDLGKNSSPLVRMQKGKGRTETQSFKIQKSKPLIDRIDAALAVHYDFTAEELDFLSNYDIQFRMSEAEETEELE